MAAFSHSAGRSARGLGAVSRPRVELIVLTAGRRNCEATIHLFPRTFLSSAVTSPEAGGRQPFTGASGVPRDKDAVKSTSQEGRCPGGVGRRLLWRARNVECLPSELHRGDGGCSSAGIPNEKGGRKVSTAIMKRKKNASAAFPGALS